jgi:hypothetical protein
VRIIVAATLAMLILASAILGVVRMLAGTV